MQWTNVLATFPSSLLQIATAMWHILANEIKAQMTEQTFQESHLKEETALHALGPSCLEYWCDATAILQPWGKSQVNHKFTSALKGMSL